MLKIAITPEEISPDEPRRITTILDNGWDMVHLRHPGATIRDIRHIIEGIPQRLHRKLRLHGHFSLVNEFNLGGLHLNSRCPKPPTHYSGALSRSCHSPKGVKEAALTGEYDYVTLSPVFDSLSKAGYGAAFSPEEISSATSCALRVIALGGVTPDKTRMIADAGFGGYAVLGYLAAAYTEEQLIEALKEFE